MSATLHLLLHLRVLTETELQSRANMHVLREAVTPLKKSALGLASLAMLQKAHAESHDRGACFQYCYSYNLFAAGTH